MNVNLPVIIKIGDIEVKGKIVSEKTYPDDSDMVELDIRYPSFHALEISVFGKETPIIVHEKEVKTMNITIDKDAMKW